MFKLVFGILIASVVFALFRLTKRAVVTKNCHFCLKEMPLSELEEVAIMGSLARNENDVIHVCRNCDSSRY